MCPLSPLTLISGVADTHKAGNPAQNGHFGCGQKEAWRQLKGVPGCKLTNEMWGNETQRVHQEVHIHEPTLSSRRHVVPHELYVRNKSKEGPRHRKEKYVYQQTIEMEGIVQSFMDEVVPRCTLFFDRAAVEQNWISIADGCGADGSWVARASDCVFLPQVAAWQAPTQSGVVNGMPGLYSSGLFVTTEGLSMKAPTVINFGWGSPARPPSTDRSSLRHNEVKRAMANIVSNPATEVERNRARAGLLYLLNGRQDGENGAQLLESDQHGYWENTLPRN